MSLIGLNNEKVGTDPVTFADLGFSITSHYENEGIISGLQVTETSPVSTSIDVAAGSFVIDAGDPTKTTLYYSGGTFTPSDNTANTYHLVVAKIDISAASSTIELLSGSSGASTDPNLTESATVYYLPLARIVTNGGNITNSDITQDNSTSTNNANAETIGKQALLHAGTFASTDSNLWVSEGNTWTFSSYSSPVGVVTVNADVRAYIRPGTRLRMTNGGNTLYGIVTTTPTYSAPNSTVTFMLETETARTVSGGNYTIFNDTINDLVNSAITNVSYSYARFPDGFPADSRAFTVAEHLVSGTQTTTITNTWYNPGFNSIDVPAGFWLLTYVADVTMVDTTQSASTDAGDITLSESASAETGDVVNSARTVPRSVDESSAYQDDMTFTIEGSAKVALTAQDTFYLVARHQATNETASDTLTIGPRATNDQSHEIRAELLYF